MFRNLVRATLALILALGLAPAAGALNITGLVIAKAGTNTADSTTNTGQNFTDTRSAVSTVLSPLLAPDTVGSISEFTTRYAMIVGLDRQNTTGTATTNMTSAYTITFTVDNPTGAQVQIDIDTLRAGTLTSITDSAGNTTITLGAATGQLNTNGGGFVAQPDLTLNGASLTSGADADQPFNQTQTNTLTILTNAVTTTYVLQFNFASSVVSATDEGAIRMGIAGGVNNSTADDYPGVTFPRNATQQANDGHFVNVTATIVPEPGAGGLVALGLLGLALRARRVSPA